MRGFTRNLNFRKSISLVIVFLLSTGFSMTAMGLPPIVEADKLVVSAGANLDKKDIEAAGKDLERIRGFKIELPINYYFQHGRYLVAIKNAVEAKQNLEIYFALAGQEGEYYESALKLYTYLEENEKRWGRFIDHGDGTLTDTQTGLMWATAEEAKSSIRKDADSYCDNYRGGGHIDWRLPTIDELSTLCDELERTTTHKFNITPMIRVLNGFFWAKDYEYISKESTNYPTIYSFKNCSKSISGGEWYYQVLPVRWP